MDKEYLEDEIDRCLAAISETLYNFSDEIVNLHTMVQNIRFAQQIQEKAAGKEH